MVLVTGQTTTLLINRINQMNKIIITLLFVTALLATACDSKGVFDSYATIPDKGWDKDSMAVFRVKIKDIDKHYHLSVNVRNEGDYQNQNLFLFIDVKGPNGKGERDTVNLILADQSGRWLGKGWGNYYQYSQLFKRGVKFPEKGEYTFMIIHGMRSDVIEGIRDIGLRVEKADF